MALFASGGELDAESRKLAVDVGSPGEFPDVSRPLPGWDMRWNGLLADGWASTVIDDNRLVGMAVDQFDGLRQLRVADKQVEGQSSVSQFADAEIEVGIFEESFQRGVEGRFCHSLDQGFVDVLIEKDS